MTEGWDARIAAVWDEARERPEDEVVRRILALCDERPDGDAAADYERASAHDFAGQEQLAASLYERALACGLDGERRPQAVIQLASTLRNLGRAGEAVTLLQDATDADEESADALAADRAAFLALALHDDARPTEALATALRALAPSLSRYGRPVAAYAHELTHPPASS